MTRHTSRHRGGRDNGVEADRPSADDTAGADLLEDDDDDDTAACCLELIPGVTLSLLVGVVTLDTGVLDLSY